MEENKVPELAVAEQEVEEVKPNIEEGLKAILASNDINEIKAIAQSLLGEEVTEEAPAEDNKEMTVEEYTK